MIRVLIVAAALGAALYGVKEERMLERATLLGSCSALVTSVGAEGEWLACSSGRLMGYPDLSRDGCVRTEARGALELWSCPAKVVASRAAEATAQ
jgi:hypothetical protein